jgi:tetratricopeptide (TPR) repeat protein
VYAAELAATTALLGRTSYGDATERGLLAVVAEQAQMTGWAAFDAGWHTEAHRLFDLSADVAREVGAFGLAGNALALRGYQVEPSTAVELLCAARDTGREATPKVRALLAERTAWAYAVAGQAHAAADALDSADIALDAAGEPEPDWVFWIDRTELQIMAGRCWTVLGRPLRAIATLEAALADYEDTHARDKALYLTYLADAYVQAGEVEHACVLLERAMSLAAGLGSARPRQYVSEIVGRLEPFLGVPAVQQVRERATGWEIRALPPAPNPGTQAPPRPAQ